MTETQEPPILSNENDSSSDVHEEQGAAPSLHSVEPKNQQDYWRWVQLQVLKERAGKSSL